MKVRNGFVSNSSSSSFCIYGYYLDKDDIIPKLDIIKKKFVDLMKPEHYNNMIEEFEKDNIIDGLEWIPSKYIRLMYDSYSSSCCDIYLGTDVECASLEELDKNAKEIKELFGFETNPSFHLRTNS